MKMTISINNLIFFNLFFILFFSLNIVYTQNPSTEFEINSILVDGCDGGNEGKNEMVLFQNGPTPLNITNIRVDGAGSTGVVQIGKWPNIGNSFLGFCTTVGATSKIATLNSAITQCGKLIEPTGGIIPKYSKVLIITSTDYTATPSFFANLTDTLYVVFQCAGNTAGHFVNYNSTSSTRTLILTNIVTSYRDTIIYDPSLLLNSAGNPGSGDGGAVRYDWDGNATYFNNGCQAPFIPLSISINPVGNIDCSTNSYSLIGNILSGSYKKIFWNGGTGSFSSPLNSNSTYTPGIGELGNITLSFNAIDICNDTIESFVNLTIYPQPISNAGNDIILCSTIPGNIGSTPINGTIYSWNSNIGLNSSLISNPLITLTNSTSISISTDYILTASVTGSGCSKKDTINITVNPLDNPTFLLSPNCNGSTASITGLVGGVFTFTTIPSDGAMINASTGTILNGRSEVTYYITYTTNGICVNSKNDSIKVLKTPDKPSILNHLVFCSTDNLPFIVNTSNINSITNYYSDISLNNLLVSNDSIQIINQIGSTFYYVTTTLNSCESLPTMIQVIIENCSIEIPTAFTPDEDQINDFWELKNIDKLYPENTVKIYNRWGALIFESPIGKYESNFWSGNYNDEKMPTGSYYFIIEFNKDDKKAESGTISIIR